MIDDVNWNMLRWKAVRGNLENQGSVCDNTERSGQTLAIRVFMDVLPGSDKPHNTAVARPIHKAMVEISNLTDQPIRKRSHEPRP